MSASLSPPWRAIGDTADYLRALQSWRRYAAAFLAGLLSALSFAPFGFFPALLVSLSVLVLLLDGAHAGPRPIWRSTLTGWAYGFGQFLAGLYWVAYAFLVDPLQHAWQIPFVAMILPGGLALFTALACFLSALCWRPGLSRVLMLTAAYAFAEWLRGHILTGFPWNLPGYAWGASLAVLQSTSFFGIYGLSVLTLLFGTSLSLLAERGSSRWVPACMTLLFAILWIGGGVRLSIIAEQTVSGVRLRLVQPNIAQVVKYSPELRRNHWEELLALSKVAHGLPPTHIIWPEAAPPFLLARVPDALADISALTGNNKVLMMGAARADRAPDQKLQLHNSFYIFGHGGELLATYDKFHLVPFGEYVPFPRMLHALGIDKMVNQPGSFDAGDGPRSYSIPGAPPVGPLICYEILFPGEVTGVLRPGWLVNVTDDSWFGPVSSTGPYQHFLIARVRAIEEGLPVARDANTGISAVIDPLGRVIAQLPLDKTGILDSPLPKALASTLFARLGDSIFWLMVLLCGTGTFLVNFAQGSRPFRIREKAAMLSAANPS